MKVLVTGVAGQLGHDMINELNRRGYEAIGSDLATGMEIDHAYVSMDITDAEQVNQTIRQICPDAVIHCAAWTAVDAAEDEENREKVYAVNVKGTEFIAKACASIGAKMMYISTDYVFDGQGESPWKPDCKDYAPLSVYGQTKLEGELAVVNTLSEYFIVRIAWVFGVNGNNFIKTMLNVGKRFPVLRVVNDQIGTPTYTFDLAKLLADMIGTSKYGYYHATNEGGYISWYEFANAIFNQAVSMGHEEYKDLKVTPVTTEEYGISKAVRPFNSRLDKSKIVEAGFKPLPIWQDALKRYMKDIEF